MTAKPLSDFESMNGAEVDFCQQTFEQFSHEYTPSDTMRTIIMRLLATIRRRDELIRWLAQFAPLKKMAAFDFSRVRPWSGLIVGQEFSSGDKQNATEILEILEAGDGN